MLRQLDAVSRDADEEVLPLGAVLSQLPVDLPVGKMLVLSTLLGLEDELMTMAAALSVQVHTVRVSTRSWPPHLRLCLPAFVCVCVCVCVVRSLARSQLPVLCACVCVCVCVLDRGASSLTTLMLDRPWDSFDHSDVGPPVGLVLL